jgi:hypothetical protein
VRSLRFVARLGLDLALRHHIRFEIFEFVRKLLLIGVLTAVSESSQAYLNVAHAVSFFSLLIFAKCQPFVDPRLDRCGAARWTPAAPALCVAEVCGPWVHCGSSGRRTLIRTAVELCSSCRLQMCAHAVTCLTIFVGIVQASASFGSVTDPSESSVQARPCAAPALCELEPLHFPSCGCAITAVHLFAGRLDGPDELGRGGVAHH